MIGQDILKRNVQSFEKGDDIQPVTKVIINYGTSDSGAILSKIATALVDDGRTVELTLSTITDGDVAQAIANNLLAKYEDDVHESFVTEGTELSPLMELGDGVAVNFTSYSDLGNMTVDFSKAMYVDLESQGISEEDDFPYLSSVTNVKRDLNTIKASITITANQIRSEVSGWTGISTWDSTTTYASGDVCYWNNYCYKSLTNGNINHQPPNSTYWEVTNEKSYVSSAITQSATSIKQEVYGNYAPTYSASTTYYTNDLVKYSVNGVYHFYRYKYATGASGIPPTNTTYWTDLGTNVTISSMIETSLNGITLSVSTGSNGSSISLKSNGITVSSDTIDLHVKSANIDGTITADTVKSDWVYTNSIQANQIGAGTMTLGNTTTNGKIVFKTNQNNAQAKIGYQTGSTYNYMYITSELGGILISSEGTLQLNPRTISLSSYHYGSSLPTGAITGQLFFKI